LAASGTGILQRQVTENATGKSYVQTIIVEDTADTAGVNAITTAVSGGAQYNLDFTNESFVGVNDASHGDLGVDAGIKLLAQGVNQGPAVANSVDALGGNNQMIASIAQGGLATLGDPTHVKIIQRQKLDSGGATGVDGTGQTDFALFSNSADESDRYMRLDQRMTSDKVETLTVRKSSGSYTTGGGTLVLPDGSYMDNPPPPAGLTYNAGDDIGVVWLQYVQFGGAGLDAGTTGTPSGTADPRQLQMQSYTVNGTTISWNSCNQDGKGRCQGVEVGDATWTYWDPNFGTAPVPINAAGNNANRLPNFPD
jgi:hypothetical protein